MLAYLFELDAEEEEMQPLAADEFFAVGDVFTGSDARELEEIRI